MSEDPNLSKRYRELPREEPSRALDDAILAASRHAVRRRRWYVPLATAAVLALAVAVTLHVQHDRPGEEVDAVSPSMQVQQVPQAPKAEAPPAKAPPRADEAPRAERREPQPFSGPPGRDPFSNRDFAGSPARAPAAAPAAAEPTQPATAAQEERKQVGELASQSAGARTSRDERARAQTQMARATIAQTQESELERIARLRAEGKHEEADRALAEFRKRYPDYRLSDEMKAKVERR